MLVLNKSGLWTSPVSKTTHRKVSTRPALAARSNTVQIFSTKDLENARNAAAFKKAAAVVPPPKPCECVELKEQNAKLEDGIMTQCRSNYRLKDDLRVMLERAQEFRNKGQQAMDELTVAEKQVRNLEQMLANDRSDCQGQGKSVAASVGRYGQGAKRNGAGVEKCKQAGARVAVARDGFGGGDGGGEAGEGRGESKRKATD